jgi:tetratricopeptide (TPR) repeat protein
MAIRLRRKTIIIIIVILVVILGGAVSAYFLWPRPTQQNTTTQATPVDTADQTGVVTVASSADAAIANNNPDQAKQIYNDAANSATTDADKGYIKLSEAKSFFGNGNLPPALDAGLQAETFLKDNGSLIDAVSTVGGIYDAMGDKANAIIYYNKTISLIDSTKNTNYDRQYYVDTVAGLKK